MTLPPNDHWLRKLIEQQRQIEKLLNPIPESTKIYQKVIDSTKLSVLGYQNALLQRVHINDYLSLSGFSESYLSLQKQIKNSLGSIDSISKELEHIRNSVGFDSILKAQENLYKLQDQFLRIDMFELPSVRIESVLAAAEATSRLWNPQSFFIDFTLSSVAEYQSFIDRQLKCLQYDKNIIAERRIKVTELSGDLFEIINSSLSIGEALERQGGESQSEEIIYGETYKSGFYGQVNQHLGFVYSDRFTGQVEEKFNKAIPTRISRLGYSIAEQVYRINSLCESNGEVPVFKPTSKTMRACAIIPSSIVKNETDFYLLVDHLFFLLYEGSGTVKRLISIANESSLDPLWKVKHLRLAARHDIDHGSNQKIEKKRAKIRDTYFSLIAKPLPTKQGDWQKAQLELYIEIDSMLQKVLEKLIEKIKKG